MTLQLEAQHVPVLLDEVVSVVRPNHGHVIIDATFGAGGYSRAFLDCGATVHAFDRDPEAIAIGRKWHEAEINPPRLILHQRRFSEMSDVLSDRGVDRVDAIVMDIGVSSMQLDSASRGFAFSLNGPLDMRMEQEGFTAGDFLNSAKEEVIADVIYHYGEERNSRRIARAIIGARPITTTGQLSNIIRKTVAGKASQGKDPATRTFQAIRIHVNSELDELRQGLSAAEKLLSNGGVLAVVSFHSLEDRIVKRFLNAASGVQKGSRHLPEVSNQLPIFTEVSKAILPSKEEISRNPRSRSSVLRHAIRTKIPARKIAA